MGQETHEEFIQEIQMLARGIKRERKTRKYLLLIAIKCSDMFVFCSIFVHIFKVSLKRKGFRNGTFAAKIKKKTLQIIALAISLAALPPEGEGVATGPR